MKFTCEQNKLIKALQAVVNVTEKKTSMPILSNILLEIKDNQAFLYGTDLEISVESKCPVESSNKGQFCTSAHTLMDIVKQLPDHKVTFELDEQQWLNITCGKAQFRVSTVNAEDFPEMPRQQDFAFLKLNKDTLRNGIDYTSYAMSTDQVRANLNGILLEIGEDKHLTMVATDGHRLSLFKSKLQDQETLNLEKNIILPRKGINELKKVLLDGSDEANDLDIAMSPAMCVIKGQNQTLFMKLVVGAFPEYSKVIPQGERKSVLIDKNALKQSLQRVSLLSEGKSKCVKMQFSSNQINLSANSPELGEAKEELNAEFNGDTMEIGFNAKYLLDAISVAPGDKVRLELDHEQSPGVLKLPDTDNYISVIMPMRI